MGSEVVREGEFLSRFAIEVEGRAFDVLYQHRGGRGQAVGAWYLVTSVPLQGVSELHSTDIRSRRKVRGAVESPKAFEKHFKVNDAGYPLRDGWLNERVRTAIAHFYAVELPLYLLSIEEARLVHRSPLSLGSIDGSSLRELLTRQAAVAAALERVL